MSKHYKPLLAVLKQAGESGAYNHQLQQVAHRFGARLQELRDGKYDGVKYNIECKYIRSGVYKYILHNNPLTDEAKEMVDAVLNPPKVIEQTSMSQVGGYEKWEKMREKLRPEISEKNKILYLEKAEKTLNRIEAFEAFYEANKHKKWKTEAKVKFLKKKREVEEEYKLYMEMSQ